MSLTVIDNNPKNTNKGSGKTPSSNKNKKPGSKITDFLWSFLIWFSIFYLIVTGYNHFFGEAEPTQQTASEVEISVMDSHLAIGQLAQFTITNNTPEALTFESPCKASATSNLKIYAETVGQRVLISPENFDCSPRKELNGFNINPGESIYYAFNGFSSDIFKEPAQYKVEFDLTNANGDIKTATTEGITYKEPGFFRWAFRGLVTAPLFNILVFFIDTFPGHSLGLAIIALTLLVRLILFLPNQKAMKSQRKLQKLQPKMESLKKKHKDNQQMLAMETMALYKKEGVSPFGSCLPILLQIPFMLGIYLVVKDGLSPHLSYLLYPFQKLVDLTQVQTWFLGLDLAMPDFFILPPLVGIAQYFAMKLAMSKMPEPPKKNDKKGNKEPSFMEQMQQMQKFMLYGLPIMITIFTATLPAAVGVYWLTSTLFGIAQQQVVNWQLDKPQVKRKES